jgi:hypothetical protein
MALLRNREHNSGNEGKGPSSGRFSAPVMLNYFNQAQILRIPNWVILHITFLNG